MVKFGRSLAFNIVLTGGIIAGLAIIADKFDLGTRLKQAAFATGQAGGAAISQPIAGIASGLTEGLRAITEEASKLGQAGVESSEGFQTSVCETLRGFGINVCEEGGEGFVFFGGDGPPSEKASEGTSPITIPNIQLGGAKTRTGETFPRQSIAERVAAILKKQQVEPNELEISRRVSAIVEGQKARSEIQKAKSGEETEFIIINGVPFSTRFLSEEEIRRQLEGA